MNYHLSLINFRETPDEVLLLTYLVAEKPPNIVLMPLVAAKLLPT